MGEGSANPTDPDHTPTIIQPSTISTIKRTRPRMPKEKGTLRYLSLVSLHDQCTQLRMVNEVYGRQFGNDLVSRRVESSKDEGLGEENESKQGRIVDIDANKDIYLVNVHTDEDMFDVNDLDGDEVIVDNASTIPVSAATTTTTTTAIITDVEVTLAQALTELKSAKPKAVKVVIQETRASSKRAGDELEQENAKKQKVDEDKETTELQSLIEVVYDDKEEVAIDVVPLATKPPTIIDWKIHKEGKKSYYQIIKADGKFLDDLRVTAVNVCVAAAKLKLVMFINFKKKDIASSSAAKDMDQDSAHIVAASKVSMLKPGEFELWRIKIEQYIQMIHYSLWEVIKNGAALPKTQMVEGVMTVMPITSTKDKAQRRLEVKARKASKLVSLLELLGEKRSQEDVTQKLLRSLFHEWNTLAVVLENKADLVTMSMMISTNIFQETSTSTIVVSCDGLGGYVWSDQAEEGPNYAIMAYSSSSSDSEATLAIPHSPIGYEKVEVIQGSRYHQKDRKPRQNDKTEHGMEEDYASAVKPEPELKNTIECNLYPSDGPGKPNSISAKTINGEVQLQALVDDKKRIVTKSTVKRDLQLEDARRVLDLEKTKTTQQNEITSLKRRVKKLEQKKRSRTHGLKRLHKVGMSRRVESSGDEEDLGEDASKQGRRINAIDVDEDITLVNVQDDADNEIFDVDALNGDEVKGDVIKEPNVPVNAASATTKVSVAITTTATILTPRKEIVITELGTPTPTISSEQSQDKDLQEKRLKRKKEANVALTGEWDDIQAKIEADHELAQRLQADEQEELSVEEKAKLFQQLLEQRRKHFAAKRAEEQRNKPPT
ncbi:hypothetical protein Tco_0150128 [Tanacetum coccineum]